ncbi:hypothetical protein EIP91_007725 [Steccherinum ochraceum]|uniref:Cytochrome P450 n=1 Tax=Steccherinum ochraceum TaxID=92696 RepID=A0A4R0R3U7_9APHY|nr:hypothetical protein EIP91_007725 [Steccherinum ochraceum]
MILDFLFDRPDLTALLALGLIVTYVVSAQRQSRFGKPLPSPRGLPIVGNIFQVGRMPWLQFTKWAKELGPIYQLNLGGKTFVILNNFQVGADILDKRSGTFSGRPRMIMTSEILCGFHFFPFLTYGDTWRKFRKMAYEVLGPRPAENFTVYQEREARLLVETLVKDNVNWSNHLHRAIASSTLSLCYAGPAIKDHKDSVVNSIDNFMHRLEQSARPGEYMVEIFPWLNYLPRALAPWKRVGSEMHEQDTELFTRLFRKAKARQTSAVQHVFILAMVLNPRVMYKAQAELDAVVGRHRMPNADDRDKLPYCRAIMRESIRWRVIGPLGVPHFIEEDDEYEGYHLPKGAIVFFNEWAMTQDPEVYGDPENFRPERFLDETETQERIPINTHGEGHTLYGYGRRKCIGSLVANSTLLINIATLLWAFDIVKAKDAQGNDITPNPDDFHDEGLVIVPAPFPCQFIPRDPDHLQDLITQAREAASLSAEEQ